MEGPRPCGPFVLIPLYEEGCPTGGVFRVTATAALSAFQDCAPRNLLRGFIVPEDLILRTVGREPDPPPKLAEAARRDAGPPRFVAFVPFCGSRPVLHLLCLLWSNSFFVGSVISCRNGSAGSAFTKI